MSSITSKKVGMKGFEPSISRPPAVHFNRTKLHPELIWKANIKKALINQSFAIFILVFTWYKRIAH